MSRNIIDLTSIAAPQDSISPDLKLTPELLGKVAVCLGMISVGLYYLLSGKRDQSVTKMIVGAVLIMAAFAVFL